MLSFYCSVSRQFHILAIHFLYILALASNFKITILYIFTKNYGFLRAHKKSREP